MQANAGGVLGVLVGWEEGVEVNVFGLTFGVSPVRLALKLPMLGNVALRETGKVRVLER